MTDDDTDTRPDAPRPGPFSWTRAELQAMAMALGALAIWGGAFALFGAAGLIVPALLLVLGAFAALVLISRG